MQVEIESITIPERVRKDLGDLTSLMESLRRIGQLNPITITPEHRLVAGHRRLESARKLGWRSIEAVVITGSDELRQLEMELEENLHRKDFTPEEALEGWKRLDKLRHPPMRVRIGRWFAKLFGALCFWKRKPVAASADASETDTDAHPGG